ncbi:SMP-30/gluconolactonase/LRE family protein [Leucothrix arctica]|uniref:ATP/GTP-binding protein n=1 Tax=Leucothrix arctica TaxID=1481894 RepID=A0A317CBK6_9GAMM|nr:ATP/GTP-binding protein [Leucothrix arctica]PWQ95747.1 ATP/GTP-binding protein [Leucothrix arctica]
MKFRHTLTVAAFALVIAQSPVIAAEKLWSLSGFNQPESVLADTTNKVLYVSNINGSPVEATGNGYISRVSELGDILDHKWVTGLGSPKGMASANGMLYVADLTFLRVIDIAQGKVVNSVEVANSKMLNDVTVDDEGNVYVTDLLAGGIYRYADKKITRWFDHEDIPHPNGIQYDKGQLLIGSWGKDIQSDFTTSEAGSVYRLGLKTKRLTLDEKAEQIGNLDGISVSGENIITNDWINGNVFEVSSSGTKLLFNAGKGAADTSVIDGKLYVPMMMDNRVDVYSLKQ